MLNYLKNNHKNKSIYMVIYSPWKVAAVTAVIVLLLQKLPRLYRLLRRKGIKTVVIQLLSRQLLKFGYFRNQFNEKDKYVRIKFQRLLLSSIEDPIVVLPEKGLGMSGVMERLERFANRDQKLQYGGRMSGSIYHGGEELTNIAISAMRLFTFANPLHADLFPAIRQMESELVQVTINLFHGNEEACGVLTSGGTESLLLAVLAYREWGRKRGIDEPEIIVPDTLHAAVDKGAHYFGVILIKVKVDKITRKVNPNDVRKQISSRTVAIFGSAPNFANGIIDPLELLGNLALVNGINFHIDACLGGYLHPFMEEAGYPIDICDFRIKGVTSISCDIHKYGYTPKGLSVLMYSSFELRRLQYFTATEWPGGLYVTPTMAGSRPGVLSAGGWAILMSMGRKGYVDCAREIMKAARFIKEEASKIEHIKVAGDPLMSVIAFESDTLNIHAIGNTMTKIRGWGISPLQNPRGIHFTLTYANCWQAESFIEDLRKAVIDVENNPEAKNYETAALYGMVAETPDKTLVGDIAKNFCDCLFTAIIP